MGWESKGMLYLWWWSGGIKCIFIFWLGWGRDGCWLWVLRGIRRWVGYGIGWGGRRSLSSWCIWFLGMGRGWWCVLDRVLGGRFWMRGRRGWGMRGVLSWSWWGLGWGWRMGGWWCWWGGIWLWCWRMVVVGGGRGCVMLIWWGGMGLVWLRLWGWKGWMIRRGGLCLWVIGSVGLGGCGCCGGRWIGSVRLFLRWSLWWVWGSFRGGGWDWFGSRGWGGGLGGCLGCLMMWRCWGFCLMGCFIILLCLILRCGGFWGLCRIWCCWMGRWCFLWVGIVSREGFGIIILSWGWIMG